MIYDMIQISFKRDRIIRVISQFYNDSRFRPIKNIDTMRLLREGDVQLIMK